MDFKMNKVFTQYFSIFYLSVPILSAEKIIHMTGIKLNNFKVHIEIVFLKH